MKFNKRRLLKKYKKNYHPKVIDWAWDLKSFNRIALVNYLVSVSGGFSCNYLEIGCASNDLFNSVMSSNKTGVDPKSGGTERMTSDQFFEANNNRTFDVIFIDGLHEYSQVRKDALNSLEALNFNGWIAFHDFLPSSWSEQNVPRLQSEWTGDCWKLALELINSDGLDFKIVNIDHGIGLLRKSKKKFSVPDLSSILSSATFEKFLQELPNLPIIEYTEAINHINSAIDSN
jgi:hypothetical protein